MPCPFASLDQEELLYRLCRGSEVLVFQFLSHISVSKRKKIQYIFYFFYQYDKVSWLETAVRGAIVPRFSAIMSMFISIYVVVLTGKRLI